MERHFRRHGPTGCQTPDTSSRLETRKISAMPALCWRRSRGKPKVTKFDRLLGGLWGRGRQTQRFVSALAEPMPRIPAFPATLPAPAAPSGRQATDVEVERSIAGARRGHALRWIPKFTATRSSPRDRTVCRASKRHRDGCLRPPDPNPRAGGGRLHTASR